jgi:predicted nucleic acid-binding protein
VVPLIIDSNIWIFAEIENYPENKIAREKIRQILNSSSAMVNAIIISEVYHKLSLLVGVDRARKRTMNILNNSKVLFASLEKETTAKAVSLAENKHLRINDAIIAQQSIEENQEILTDNIRDFARIGSLKIVPLR